MTALSMFATATAVAAPSRGARAKTLFKQGQLDFKDQDYDSALKNFRKAHKLKPLPDILFMVGQAYRNLKQYDKAIEAFEGYLKGKPEATDQAEVRRLIEELEFMKEVSSGDDGDTVKDLDDSADDPPEKPAPKPLVTPKPPKPPTALTPKKRKKTPVYKKWWFWAAVGGGLAAAGVGTYFIAREAGSVEMPAGSLGTLDLR